MHQIYFYRDRSGKEPIVEYMKELSRKKDKDSRIKLDKINEASGDKHGGIMPQSRMLIRRTADGSEEIIKKGVLDYIPIDSGVIVSNGRHLLRIDMDGNETHIAKAKLAVNLVAVDNS